MAQQKGSKSSVRIYEETVFGQVPGPTPNGLLLPVIDTDLRLSQDLIESRVLTGNRNPQEPVPNEKEVTGGITFQPDVRSTGFILKHLMGTVATTVDTPTAGVNEHLFTIGDLPIGLTFEKWFPQIPISLRYFGGKINTVRFDVGTGGLLEATMDIMAVDEDSSVATALDATPLLYAVKAFRLPSVTLSEGGSGLTIATRFSMEATNAIEGIRTVGNLGRYADFFEGIFRVTGTMSVLFQSMALYNKAKNQTTSALVLTFPATETNMDMQWMFDEVKYSISSPSIPGPGGIQVDMNWQAFVQSGTSAARVKLHNDVTNYTTIT